MQRQDGTLWCDNKKLVRDPSQGVVLEAFGCSVQKGL